MIGNGLKNFFRNLKYIFTPLGVLALGVVMGFCVLGPACSAAVRGLVADVKTIADSVSVDFPALKDAVVAAVRALDWSQPIEAVSTVLRKEWLTKTLNGCVQSMLPGSESVSDKIVTAVDTAAAHVVAGMAVFIFFVLLSLAGGYMLTKFLVRRDVARRGIGKFFLAACIDSLLSTAFIVALTLLHALWAPGAVILGVAAVLLAGAAALLEAYLLHARRSIPLKKVVNGKNVALLYASGLIICCIAVAFFLLLCAVCNAVVAIFLGIPLAEITLTVLGLNAESYVLDVVRKAQVTPAEA